MSMTFEHIPERMKQTPHWIVWRLEDRGDPKPNKTPYCVRGGYWSRTYKRLCFTC